MTYLVLIDIADSALTPHASHFPWVIGSPLLSFRGRGSVWLCPDKQGGKCVPVHVDVSFSRLSREEDLQTKKRKS